MPHRSNASRLKCSVVTSTGRLSRLPRYFHRFITPCLQHDGTDRICMATRRAATRAVHDGRDRTESTADAAGLPSMVRGNVE